MSGSHDIDIIMLALARWDGLYSSTAFSMAKQLSRTNRVFYIDNPFTYKDVVRGVGSNQVRSRLTPLFTGRHKYRTIDADNKNLINVVPRAVFPINFLPPGKLYDQLSRLNDHAVRAVVSGILRDYGVSKFILFNCFNPFYLYSVDTIKPVCSVYYSVDNIAASKYIYKHGIYLEKRAMQNYDLTLTTSRELYNYAGKFGGNTRFLPNAVDFDLFQQAFDDSLQRPAEIADVSTKIIGYMGHIDHRIDYALLKQVATTHADKTILLIGPVSAQEFYRTELDKLPNVITTGKKKLEELPAYLKFIDCSIIPFLRNELTSCIYPLKLNEYLAGGKPVITTRFSPDLSEFEEVVKIADDHHRFAELIDREIVQDSDDKRAMRVSRARSNTWSIRVKEFWEIVSPYLDNVHENA